MYKSTRLWKCWKDRSNITGIMMLSLLLVSHTPTLPHPPTCKWGLMLLNSPATSVEFFLSLIHISYYVKVLYYWQILTFINSNSTHVISLLYIGPNLLGAIEPLMVHILSNPNKYSDPSLQASSSLALAKFMLVSPETCEKHLQLLFTILERVRSKKKN